MDNKSMEEQSNIINRAEYIIGMHGAAFTNLIFAHKNAKVLEFSPKTYIDAPTAFISQALEFSWSRRYNRKGSKWKFDLY